MIPMVLGLFWSVLCEDVSASDAGDTDSAADKRFADAGSKFGDQHHRLVDWNKVFKKRSSFRGSDGFDSGDDAKLIDWSRMFKRFGTQGHPDPGDDLVRWNSEFSKRFYGNTDRFSDDDGNMVDWSSAFKRFGSADPDHPNLVDWSAMFQKRGRARRSAFGEKRFRSGHMGFAPTRLEDNDLIDWSRVFRKRQFGGADGGFGGAATFQDWRSGMARKRAPGFSVGHGGGNANFGRSGLVNDDLQDWNTVLWRKKREAPSAAESAL